MKKAIDHILEAREKKITEEDVVLQPLPHQQFRFANPFIVLHHMRPVTIRPGQSSRIHPHPHRGFSPYTIMLQGEGYHRDNAGNDKVVKAGDVQQMFAGKGILHSEGPTDELLKTGGTQELIQLWINAPKASKWDEPFYQAATKDQQPHVLLSDGLNFRLLSGDYEGKTGPIKNFTPVISIVGEVTAGKTAHFTATPGYWTLLYIIHGDVEVNDHQAVSAHNLIVFSKENEDISVTATTDAQVLYLSAEPIEEPVAAKDNFVMNTPEENEQAIADYKNGLFGTLSF
ncbi:pirin family protein [Mucilaginibacter sp. HC2]|uniref:pirin family protein n=1 Tax=Mucilaginibacter inviolabilis TaxID=2714892 RepID=UPI00140D6AFF|nr:pirin family protein [Mucilaginibacter inviolabilis]NHA02211.1 pirin family protein [Mucilaginibacter inviolabilis]